jgi:hypothetical protein
MVRSTFRAWAKVALPSAFIALVALAGLVGRTDSSSAYGNGDGTSNTGTVIGTPIPFTEVFSNTFTGDYVSAGVGMRDSGPPGSGTIAVPPIPGTATVTQAYLYWAIMDNPPAAPALANATINGNAVIGNFIGTTEDPCWSGDIHVYVADVTAFVLTGANNNVTGFASGGAPATLPLLEGASIVAIYSDPSLPNRTVKLAQGAISFSAPPPETYTFSGFNAAVGTSRTTWIVADGQPGLRNQTQVDGNLTADFVLDGSSTPGTPYWDDLTQDISAFVPVNDTDVTVEVVSENFGGHDCLTWVAQALSVPAPEPPGTGGPPVVGGIVGLLERGPQAPDATGDGEASSWIILAIALGAGLTGFTLLSSGAAILAYRRRRVAK